MSHLVCAAHPSHSDPLSLSTLVCSCSLIFPSLSLSPRLALIIIASWDHLASESHWICSMCHSENLAELPCRRATTYHSHWFTFCLTLILIHFTSTVLSQSTFIAHTRKFFPVSNSSYVVFWISAFSYIIVSIIQTLIICTMSLL